MAYEIRQAKAEDAAAITALLNELNREEGQGIATDGDSVAKALSTATHGLTLQALVAVEAQTIIATLLYYTGYDTLTSSYGYHLADIIVTSQHRRQGIGRALVKALGQQALSEGKEWVSLTVLKENQSAHAFYNTLGMTKVDVDFYAAGKRTIGAW